MKRTHHRRTWKTATAVALAAVVGLASPAVAAPTTSTTSVTASPAAAYAGAYVTLNVTVTCEGDPSGNPLGVTFFDGADPLEPNAAVGPDGKAVKTVKFTTPGSHVITAAYNGNDNCFASSGKTTVEVTALPTPPTPPANGFCFLVCSLIGFSVGNIGNHIEIH
ncbi:Ig-like domain-containing protein [Streptomyces sp. NPDC001381]|uniref:Ig-like domain-containing protein n=1 Tax=Streptomyces sp. NPDC001381 TaxID=3364567 RepID=UPI003692361A